MPACDNFFALKFIRIRLPNVKLHKLSTGGEEGVETARGEKCKCNSKLVIFYLIQHKLHVKINQNTVFEIHFWQEKEYCACQSDTRISVPSF